MTRYSELTPDSRQWWTSWIDERHETLDDQYVQTGEKALRYLTLTNGGSAATLAAFMGSSPSLLSSSAVWVAQGFFLFGLLCVGLLIAFQYHYFNHLVESFSADTRAALGDQIPLEELRDNDRARNKRHLWIGVAFAYGAFGAFLFGAITAVLFVPANLS